MDAPFTNQRTEIQSNDVPPVSMPRTPTRGRIPYRVQDMLISLAGKVFQTFPKRLHPCRRYRVRAACTPPKGVLKRTLGVQARYDG